MMDWTDRHCRFFHRQLTRHALLYSEMVTADAVIHGERDRLIGFSSAEHPVALQLGGSDPDKLAEASRIGADFGYDEINLNIGCPSDRVKSGRFGACLMAEPDTVAACVAAMSRAVQVPVTVKCRIGIDDQDSEHDFRTFIDRVADAGCKVFIVHARKAWLTGLSPKQNRDVPPLNYGRVHRLKAERPELEIIINGGIETLDDAQTHLTHVDGVMLGRAAYHTPAILRHVDGAFYGDQSRAVSADAAVEAMVPYIDEWVARGGRVSDVTRHILGVFHGQPGARVFRRHLSENGVGADVRSEVVLDALQVRRRAARLPEVAA